MAQIPSRARSAPIPLCATSALRLRATLAEAHAHLIPQGAARGCFPIDICLHTGSKNEREGRTTLATALGEVSPAQGTMVTAMGQAEEEQGKERANIYREATPCSPLRDEVSVRL